MAMQYRFTPEIQADGFRTLCLMNPNFLGYNNPDAQFPQYSFFNLPHALPSSPATHAPLPPPSRPSSEELIQASLPRDNFSVELTAEIMANPMENGIMGSKYVKAAQELLEEVASVRFAGKGPENVSGCSRGERSRDKAKTTVGGKIQIAETGRGCNKGGRSELTAAQRQEILMKKAKLNTMLDEVDQRCKQYRRQMQLLVSSLEHVAGSGSAKSYTDVPLRTILRQFQCLRATVLGQIKTMNKTLGEEEEMQDRSRLKFSVNDHRLAGIMMGPNTAWRPQRGLPERSVSVLRAWLFNNFLHPYPKHSDKQILAKQTGLTRNQVSNWFINARVRLWKPMVEAMYLEEINKQGNNPRHAPDTSSTPKPTIPINPPIHNNPTRPNFHHPKPHHVVVDNNKPGGSIPNPLGSFVPYRIFQLNHGHNELAHTPNFQGNGFSLSLGLPPSQHQGFIDFGTTSTAGIHHHRHQGNNDNNNNSQANIGYNILDFQNRKTFQALALPDFVA